MNIIKATDLSPRDEVLLIATLPREVKSWKYQEYDPDTILIEEAGTWDPLNKSYKPTAFRETASLLDELVQDEKYRAIIIDNGTEVGEFAWHDSLAPLKIGDPNELGTGGNRFAPYTSIRERMENFIMKVNRLTNPKACAREKHIIIPWHVQEPKDDETSKKDVEYAGKELPMIRGGFRRRIGQKIDVIVYMTRKVADGGKKVEYKLQVVSDMEKHCKVPCQVPQGVKFINPTYEALLQLI
jgi:hypothetical protein